MECIPEWNIYVELNDTFCGGGITPKLVSPNVLNCPILIALMQAYLRAYDVRAYRLYST